MQMHSVQGFVQLHHKSECYLCRHRKVQLIVIIRCPGAALTQGPFCLPCSMTRERTQEHRTGIWSHAKIFHSGFCAAALQGWMLPVQTQDMGLLKVQPMVVPPLPWRSTTSGGLLFTRQHVMRMRTQVQAQALQEAEAALPDGMRKVSHTCLSE